MRELHADRADSDGAHIIVMDLESGEEFRVAVDSTLRTLVHPPEPAAADPAAADPAGRDSDVADAAAASAAFGASGFGSVESTGSGGAADAVDPVPVLTPRDIQARIRAGATVEELAEASGVDIDRIARFAHPVLLERSRAAELARASHPLSMDGPVAGTLGEMVTECLVLRGAMPQHAKWDAWRTESGQWVVQVSPEPGSAISAHWRFIPGAHGGTTDPLDDFAVELTEPELARTHRRPTIVPVPVPAAETAPPTREVTADGHEYVTVDADDLTEGQQRRRSGSFGEVLDLRHSNGPRVETPTAPGEKEPAAPRHRGKRATPTVPAWEDVLLGVRSHPNE